MSTLNFHANVLGDYRTQRVILEIYDALAEAMRTGKDYQTRVGQAEDARADNELITSWTGIESAAATAKPPEQPDFFNRE